MTEEECRKNNICPFCYGKIYLKMPKERQIRCTCEDGTYVGYSISEKSRFDKNRERDNREHKLLQDWVKENSKCKTCGGDQKKLGDYLIVKNVEFQAQIIGLVNKNYNI